MTLVEFKFVVKWHGCFRLISLMNFLIVVFLLQYCRFWNVPLFSCILLALSSSFHRSVSVMCQHDSVFCHCQLGSIENHLIALLCSDSERLQSVKILHEHVFQSTLMISLSLTLHMAYIIMTDGIS